MKSPTTPIVFSATFSVTLLLSGCANFAPIRAVAISSASTSHTLCTAAFVSGLDPARAYREEVLPAPGMSLIAWALNYEIDSDKREVRASVAGRSKSRAVYREGLGCVLDFGSVLTATWTAPINKSGISNATPDAFPSLSSASVVSATDERIRAAIDQAFAEPSNASERTRRTQAVVIVHKGQLIGERYAQDIHMTTPLPGHSISKSLTHALIGSLALNHKLDPDKPLNIAAWQEKQDPQDPRASITPNHLLAMASGLPFDEYAGGWDESTRMWFVESDPFAYATSVAAVAPVATKWNYSNLGYAVLSRVIRDRLGGKATDVLNYAHQEIFEPLGMRTAVLTFDGQQTPLGSHLFLASARDWARFGLLYLNNGSIAGRQIVSKEWVSDAQKPTLDAGYGRGFWLNNTSAPHRLPGKWGMPGAPADAYFARGYLGQFIVIVPSLDLVIVRLGISYRRGGDIDTVGEMVRKVSQAITMATNIQQ